MSRTRPTHSTHQDSAAGRYAGLALVVALLGAIAALSAGCRSGGLTPQQVADIVVAITRPTPGPSVPPSTPPTQPPNIPPTEDPPTTPPTTPPVTEPVVECRFAGGLPPFERIPSHTCVMGDAVRQAGEQVLGCTLGSDGCRWSTAAVPAFDALTTKLRAAGHCAGRYDDDHSGEWSGSDVISVKPRGPGKDGNPLEGIWEEYSVFNFGPGHATAFRCTDAFRVKVDGPHYPPNPPAEPELQCLTLDRIVLDIQDGKAKRHINATPQHRGREECAAFGHDPTKEYCPLGMEGNPARAQCEARSGPYTWAVTPDPGWDYAKDDGVPNPLVIKLEARIPGTVVVCSATGPCGSVATK